MQCEMFFSKLAKIILSAAGFAEIYGEFSSIVTSVWNHPTPAFAPVCTEYKQSQLTTTCSTSRVAVKWICQGIISDLCHGPAGGPAAGEQVRLQGLGQSCPEGGAGVMSHLEEGG